MAAAEGTRGLYIDMWASATPPAVDSFIVSITKAKAIGTIYHVAEVRKVVPRVKRRLVRYQMRVYVANDLKPEAHYNPANGRAWVKDQEAIPMQWYPRKTKASK